MNYKKLIKSRDMRRTILRALCFIPDKTMIKLQYFIKMNRWLNLKNPKRLTEKLQWYKLYYRDPLMVQCVDKYDVRQYVKSLGLGSILNECYGVFERAEDVDFDALPDKFVIKDTLGGGGNSVIIVENKDEMNREDIRRQMHEWTQRDPRIRGGGREWPYHAGKNHRIIVEKFIESNKDEGGLIDYKFFCFNGRCEFMYVIADRVLGEEAGIGMFDRNCDRMSCSRRGAKPLTRNIPKPANFDQLLAVAERLSCDFPHARIDLFNQNGQILFGEITYFSASGYMLFDPDSFDVDMGRKWTLPKVNIKK